VHALRLPIPQPRRLGQPLQRRPHCVTYWLLKIVIV
jgi:hypothetical protein